MSEPNSKAVIPLSAWMEEKQLGLDHVLAGIRQSRLAFHHRLDQLISYMDGSGIGDDDQGQKEEGPAPYPPDWPSQATGIDRVIHQLSADAEDLHKSVLTRMETLAALINGAIKEG